MSGAPAGPVIPDPLQTLIAESRTPGEFVERRSFTLSREKAIEKQREFALRHPRQYVLELVQAAVFAGASYLAIDSSANALVVAWVGGRALGARELESLFDYLFTDRADPRWRHVVQLAIGVNALLQRAPKLVRIESGDGSGSVRMELDASGHAVIGRPRDPVHGTYVHVRYDLGWLARFRNTAPLDEIKLVEERCLYTPIPILLNGSAPFGYHASRRVAVFAARAAQPFDEDGRHGVIAAPAGPNGPRGFRIVVGGVWITTLPLADLASYPLFGVVCDDGLRKTADQSDIVRDEAYTRMLHALQPRATALLRASDGPEYEPPPLPPLGGRATDPPHPARRPAREALPELLTVLGRPLLRLAELGRRRSGPLFWVSPEHRGELTAFSVDRFPWAVLVLGEAQVRTLQDHFPGLEPMRLASNTDLEFVRRVIERRGRTRAVSVPVEDGLVQVRLHAEGPLPDWGPGVPFCVVGPRGVVEYGGIDGRVVRRGDGRTRPIGVAFALPRVSVLVHHRKGHLLDDGHLHAAIGAAHRLAVGADGECDGALLAAAIAAVAVPQLVRGEDAVRVDVSLPLDWPASLRAEPLAPGLTLDGLIALIGTDEVRPMADLAGLLALDELEKRLGYGHLTHPSLAGRPLLGAGRFAERWQPLDTPESWSRADLKQAVWVRTTFADAPLAHGGPPLTPDPQPVPVLAAASRAGEARGYDEGWRCLFAHLQRIEADREWDQHARGPISAGRAEGLGRLALIYLAAIIGAEDLPLLVPSDGGGRRSLRDLRALPGVRMVARRGVRLAEPLTFAVTRDELRAIGDQAHLRYGDAPDVWRSLTTAGDRSDEGWLVRQEVHKAGLRGWLGLRVPHEGKTGVLLRTTGELVSLSDLERGLPCHGLLWTEEAAPNLSAEQRRHAQLAGLRLYQGLVRLLDEPGSAARAAAARQYAIPYVLVVWARTGALQGTARELARRIELSCGISLDQWLALAPEHRPPAPELATIASAAVPLPRSTDPTQRLVERLIDAIGATRMTLIVNRSPHAPGGAITWVEGDSHRGRLVLGVNAGVRAVQVALERDGPEREVLLLEIVRQICRWGAEWGLELDLLRAQEALLGQRLAS